uniref:Phosphoinositide phospholipase C n=1 Tax=Gadus morhua TaxID=8049 RepID=A0A8C5D084_GADMO
MMAGSTFRKVKSHSWKKPRHFRLLEDGLNIWYKSSTPGFLVSDVEAVRQGHQSEVLQSIADEFPPNLCFTLEFRGRQGNLDLVAETPEEAGAWVRGMRKLIHKAKNMDEKERLDQWVWDWFLKADKNKDGRMNFKEVRKLLKMMNVDMNEDHAFYLFTMADTSMSSSLEIDEFVMFYKMLTQRDEVWKLFQDYSSDGEMLSRGELENILRIEQQEGDGCVEHAQELIDRYEPSEMGEGPGSMSLDGFQLYLCSQEGSIFNTSHKDLYQDMSQPLSHYFLSSSHNTYLLEDQLRGQSSLEAYIQALKRGCRCVEIDCWDGPDDEPVVYHGHTLTSKILFRDVIATISEYAFKASDYPLILSLENHCGVEQQRVMAQHLELILGSLLLRAPLGGEAPQQLPSPQDLKGKILLKTKKIGCETLTDEVSDEDETVNPDPDSPSTDQGSAECPPDPSKKVESISAEYDYEAILSKIIEKMCPLLTKSHSKLKMSRELSDLVVYCKSVHFRGFQHAQAHYKCDEMSSLSESKARKLAKEAGADFVQHNIRQLSRIYPSGLRTVSSNYNPQELWNVGCQIVALNFQTAGLEMDLNDGLFHQNAGCGYVLKPGFMRDSELPFDPETPQEHSGYAPLRLSIQILSGQQLPKVNQKEGSIIDPLVRVEVYGVPQDLAKEETSHIQNNGFNPVWNETLNFIVHNPGLALVRFVVEDHDKASRNDFVGQFTLPFTSIRPGYRHIHLLSKDGTSIPPASLFVNVSTSELTSGPD